MLRKNLYTYLIEITICLLFLSVSLYIMPYHEHWADEAQAFLIARDVSLKEILTQIPHQEGQPVLWHILLKLCIVLLGDEINISYISVGVMFVVVVLVTFFYHIPLIYKILLPFGYYFLYQYNIIARNYCLAYLALAILGLCYPRRHNHPYQYTFSLIFFAETTTYYSLVALVLGLKWIYEARNHLKDILGSLALLCLGGSVLLWQIFPLNNYVTPQYFLPSPILFLRRIFDAFGIFANETYLALLAVTLSLYFCNSRIYQLAYQNIFKLIFILLCFAPFALLYSEIYHAGLIWGLFLLLVYILFPKLKPQLLSLIIFGMQIYQSVIFITYDKMFSYTAVPMVIETLQKHKLIAQKLYVFSYSAIPLYTEIKRKGAELDLAFFTSNQLYNNWQRRSCTDYNNLQAEIVVVDKTSFQCNLNHYEDNSNFSKYEFNTYAMPGIMYHPLTLYIKKQQP